MPPTRDPLAIVGLAALFPGSRDAHGFWRDIVAGRDLIGDVPASHWLIEDYYDPDPAAPDKTYARRGAFLDPVDFDPLEFGIPPSIVPATDTSQLLALIVAKRALEDATRGRFPHIDRERVSVILGTSSAQELVTEMSARLQRPVWLKALREHGVPEDEAQAICERIAGNYVGWQESTFPGLLGNVIAGRIANRMDLGGTNCVTDAACASSLAALSMAAAELWLGNSDLVLTGGVETLNDIFMFMCFSKTPAMSRTGDCRPFAAAADGTMLGEGLGMIALRRLEDAVRDGDRVYAVLRGIGASSDGRAKSIYAPVAGGQERALRRAYESAGYGPDTVELVEAHGTATAAGDAAEYEALQRVFRASGKADDQWCALGSVKSQLGHTKSAAGIAGLIKAVLALHHKLLPPTIKVDQPNPNLGLEKSPFYLNTEARPWIKSSDQPRRAAVSSFGFGGSDFHATLEEYNGPGPVATRVRVAPTELVLLSAPSGAQLAAACRDACKGTMAAGALGHLALRTQTDGAFASGGPARLAVVAADEQDLRAKLERAARTIESNPATPFSLPTGVDYAPRPLSGGVAFLFPGQGSQRLRMGGDLAMAFDVVRDVWDRTADAATWDSLRLADVVYPRPVFSDGERAQQARRLTATEWAQPALGVTSAATLALLNALGIRADAVAGHSFGELTALFAAGAFSLGDLVRAARCRGEVMSRAATVSGAMIAVAESAETLRALIEESGDDVVIANYNSPRQTVLSGPAEAIGRLESRLERAGMAATRLRVSTAFHSPLVAPSVPEFRRALDQVSVAAPSIPVFGTSDATQYSSDGNAVRERLAAQLALPVRFVAQVEALYAAGARLFVEVGPGSTLTSLAEDCLVGREVMTVATDHAGRNGVTALWMALGRMAVAGVPVNFRPLWEPYLPLPSLPEAKGSHTLTISGTNYGKPYPPPGGAAELPPPNLARVTEAAPTSVSAPAGVGRATSLATPEWVQAFQEIQRQTAEAHAAYERAMAESHTAFLKTAEASIAALRAIVTGGDGAALPLSPETLAPGFAAPIAPPTSVPAPHQAAVPMRTETLRAAPPAAPSPPRAAAKPVESVDVESLLREVVEEKTGYPAEMLGLQMSVEADLGIDSIKRVEILAAIQQRAPHLPSIQPADLATLKTLEQIAAFLAGKAPSPGSASPPSSSSPVAPAMPASEIRRHEPTEVLKVASGFAVPGLFDGPIAVVGDDVAIAPRVVELLRVVGVDAVLGYPDAMHAAVLFLGGLRRHLGVEEAIAVNREAFRLARAIASRTGGPRLLVLVQDTGGDFGRSGLEGRAERAWLGGLPALAKTVAREWPDVGVKAIDLETSGRAIDAIADALVHELMRGGSDLEVGLRADGRRTIAGLAETPATEIELAVDDRSVIVATGGARGITAESLLALSSRAKPRIALLGRTALVDAPTELADCADETALMRALATRHPELDPGALRGRAARALAACEIRQTMATLAAAGVDVMYRQVDVRDRDEVASACREVRVAFGPITAIVHGAGVISDATLVDKSDDAFDRVFDTKVMGLRALLDATAEDPLRLLCIFSSAAARFGNSGQSDYAMANGVLSTVAAAEARRRGPHCTVRAIEWGAWSAGMVNASLQTHMQKQGIPLLSPAEGARHFVREVSGNGTSGAAVTIAPLAPDRHAPLRLEVVVDDASHPFLADHRLDDVPVLPVVLVLEWFVRASEHATGIRVAAIRDLAVRSGVRLESFGRGAHRFVVQMRRADDALALELRGADGKLHYSATAVLSTGRTRDRRDVPVESVAMLEPWPSERAIYTDLLFQGREFQVVRSVHGMAQAGASAEVAAIPWAGAPWLTDPAMLEGGLQLAQLWGHRTVGTLTLPTGIEEYVRHSPDGHGPVRCVLRARAVSNLKTISDVVFHGANGDVLAELRGIEMHVIGKRRAAPTTAE